jgi:hypothetical protein
MWIGSIEGPWLVVGQSPSGLEEIAGQAPAQGCITVTAVSNGPRSRQATKISVKPSNLRDKRGAHAQRRTRLVIRPA